MSSEKALSESGASTPPVEGDVAHFTVRNGAPAWSRFLPGPSPRYRFNGLPKGYSGAGVVVCGSLIFMLSGYNVALMGSVSPTSQYLETIGLTGGTTHDQLLIGVVNAMYWVGVVIGALFIGSFSGVVGRRKAIVCAALYILCVVPILSGLQNFGWALALRFLNGLGTGALDSVCLNFSAETAHHKSRGRSIGFELCCAALGAAQAYFIVYGLQKHATGDIIFRFPLAFQCVFAILILLVVRFLPESPRWLVGVGMTGEARDVLRALKAGTTDDMELVATVESDIAAIQKALDDEAAHNTTTSYFAMLTKRDAYSTARRTWSAMFVQFATQAMVGVGFVSGYGIAIFVAGGWSSELAAALAGACILVQAIVGIAGALLADKMGRRIALAYGPLFGATLLAMIGMCGHFVAQYVESDPPLAKKYGSAVVALMYLWSAQFGMTWLWAPFTYPSELFPARSRAKGSSFGIVGFALGAFFCNMISPYLFAAVGYKVMFLLAGLSMIVSIVNFLFMPETANKTLEEIDHLYD